MLSKDQQSRSNLARLSAVLVLLTSMFLVGCPDDPPVTPDPDPYRAYRDYLPLNEGTIWTYSQPSGQEYSHEIIKSVVASNSFGDSAVIRIDRGNEVEQRFIYYWDFDELRETPLDSTSTYPIVHLSLPPDLGTQWLAYDEVREGNLDERSEAEIVARDTTLSTRAGTFNRCIIVRHIRSYVPSPEDSVEIDTFYNAFAYNIGLIYFQDQHGGRDELISYRMGQE